MTGFVEHDGRSVYNGPVAGICFRDPTGALGHPRWLWAEGPHLPEDVMAYCPGATEAVAADARATRATILEAARQAVLVDRAATHGAPEASFGEIAALWSVRLGVTVTPAQVTILLCDLKTVRAWHNPGHVDNWIDIAGYGACGGEVALLSQADAVALTAMVAPETRQPPPPPPPAAPPAPFHGGGA